MNDWVSVIALSTQTLVLLYASVKLNKMNKMMERLVKALIHISEDMEEAVRDMRSIQDDMTELEDLIRTALRGSK